MPKLRSTIFVSLALSVLLVVPLQAQDAETSDVGLPYGEEPAAESSSLWQSQAFILLTPREPLALGLELNPLVALTLFPDIFSLARPDLADLRIFDSSGKPYPYALRYRKPKSVRDQIPATEFNRLEPEVGVHELTLELNGAVVEHNEVQIVTTGDAFRRAVEIDGSDDGQQWRRLVTGNLLRFAAGEQKIDVESVTYPVSRFRYVRIRVQPDPSPSIDADEKDKFSVKEAKVLRTVDLPGERSQWDTLVETREPTRIFGAAGSSWIIDLQGLNVPCDRVDVEVADNEFVREVQLQAEQPSGLLDRMVFTPLYSESDSTWQRKLGEPKQPMTIRFPEVQTSRLRLLVTDYQNKPLRIVSAKISAASRQIVFPQPAEGTSELRLFVGNPLADVPNYDFARNLPERLDTASQRVELATPTENANYVPLPLPFTERFPWLIYIVLGTVCVLLLVIIASLARKAVTIHDSDDSIASDGDAIPVG